MEILRSIWSIRVGRVSLIVLALVVLLAIFGSPFAPQDPFAQNAANRLKGVSLLHPFGTDYLGRDLLSRLLVGSGLSVVAAFEALGFALVIGVVPGLLSLYLGRPFEWISMRIMEALVALPFIVFAVSMAALLGNGLHQAMLAVGILMSPAFFRVTRAVGQASVNSQYVAASRLMGSSTSWILWHHVWPKVLPAVAITAAAAIGNGLVVISSLTFLGIGVAPPTPSWGGILSDQVGYLYQQPFAIFPPAFLIIATVGAAHGLADALRDVTNPSPRRVAPVDGKAKLALAETSEMGQ